MKLARRLTLPLFAAALSAATLAGKGASANVPLALTQQGRLFDAEANPIQDKVTITFAIYAVESGGAPLWSETHPDVAIDDGYFSVRLGSVTPFDTAKLFDGSPRYLGITIGDDTEMTPRQAVGSVPYALVAGDVTGDIHPASVTVNGVEVIDDTGHWVGPGGTAGATGAMGPTGATGPQGDVGATGPAGMAGPTGATGLQGPIGLQGPTGPAGADGATGLVGPMGPLGPMGPAGATGAMGVSGGALLDLEFDEPSGTSFADSSGYGNAATGSGALTAGAAGHADKAVSFSGGLVSIAGPTNMPDSPQVSVEAWVYPLGALNTTRTILTKVGAYTLKQVNADVSFQVTAAGGPCTVATAGSPLGAGSAWNHVAGWYDGLTASVAVNGVVLKSVGCANGPIVPTPAAPFNVGAASAGIETYQGYIDELRVRGNAARTYVDTIRTIARWQSYANDGTDSGPLAGRTVVMAKKAGDTGLRVVWSDNFRVQNNGGACRWEVLFNGAPCASPGGLYFDKYEGGTFSNRFDPSTFTGTCFGLGVGNVTVSTRVGVGPAAPLGDCFTGWSNQLASLEVEEVR